MMNKVDAILAIIQEARREKGSRAAMLRTERALRALGCLEVEVRTVLSYLDYWSINHGGPYPQYLPRKPK